MPADTHVSGRIVDATGEAALVAADAALSAGWGSGRSVAVVANSVDRHGHLDVTVGTSPSANPTVTVTFKRPFNSRPFVSASRGDAVTAQAGIWSVQSVTATQVVFIFLGTPVAAQVIGLEYETVGGV
jgi:hypothetical protein